MRRIEVADGIWVVDHETGIGSEGYVPPNPRRQRMADTAAPDHDPMATDIGEQPPSEEIPSEEWKAAGKMAIDAVALDPTE